MKILSPLGWLYGRVTGARNAVYDRGVLRTYPLGAKTISVGNITAGGTGKTPLVAMIAQSLTERGEKVCILTRGYGRTSRGRILVSDGEHVLVDAESGGDEPVELARKLLGRAVIVADADRVGAARWAREKFGITTFVLDDGYQHRRAKRDFDIVCIDATDPFGGGELLPAGRLRENLAGLSRADAVVITRSDQGRDIDGLQERLQRYIAKERIFLASSRVAGIYAIEEMWTKKAMSISSGDLGHAFAFCGLGNPKSFLDLLSAQGIRIDGSRSFPDHYTYDQDDLDAVEKAAKSIGAECLITTVKDAVKLEKLKFKLPCRVVEIESVVSEGFIDLLSTI